MKDARTHLFLLALTASLLLPGCATRNGGDAPRIPQRTLPPSVRAVWVARFHYKTPQDIVRIMDNARDMGFNTVLWQVRGQGAVAYPSHFEPWSETYGGRDPGFDPLAIAVAEAHKRGMRIEAWMNLMPGWKGPKPPADPAQMWNAHPDWFLLDAQNNRQPLGDFYVIVNPALPEVRRHLVNVAEELIARYDIDGLHLDYVRYAWDTDPQARNKYMRDARTLEIYRRETGLAPDQDLQKWDAWRANQITRVVHEIRTMMDRRRPAATLTAAVWRNPALGYNSYLQNAPAWLRSGLVDAAMPMAYTRNTQQFEADIAMYRQAAPGRRVIPGIGAYLHTDPGVFRQQMQACHLWGGDYAVYAYESLAPTGPGRGKPDEEEQRNARRAILREFRPSRPPGPPPARL